MSLQAYDAARSCQHEFHLEPPSEKTLNSIFHLKVTVARAPNETVMVGEGKEVDAAALTREIATYGYSISDRE